MPRAVSVAACCVHSAGSVCTVCAVFSVCGMVAQGSVLWGHQGGSSFSHTEVTDGVRGMWEMGTSGSLWGRCGGIWGYPGGL